MWEEEKQLKKLLEMLLSNVMIMIKYIISSEEKRKIFSFFFFSFQFEKSVDQSDLIGRFTTTAQLDVFEEKYSENPSGAFRWFEFQ